MAGAADAGKSEHVDPARSIGRRLELVRKRRGWTIREMAEHAGYQASTLHYRMRRRRRAWDYYELRGLVENLGEVWDPEWERLWRLAVDAEPVGMHTRLAAPGFTSPSVQLPTVTKYFTGRAHELAYLAGGWGGASTCVLEGMAGVGKTALAVRAAHDLARRFGHGALFLDLHGFAADHEPMPCAFALDVLLRALGVSPERIPPGLDCKQRGIP